jgi:hypothetical protein
LCRKIKGDEDPGLDFCRDEDDGNERVEQVGDHTNKRKSLVVDNTHLVDNERPLVTSGFPRTLHNADRSHHYVAPVRASQTKPPGLLTYRLLKKP